ncbi:hypothetical protein E1A91_A05G302400v1 [Gossypium mustelinum]|uniref:Uncharacterized protein n=1 Tax=Gossypium mustelinum TaxID=34275 RepID=A0A5D2ZDU9_GOSMU|nr:hypothetical protein E1A91_A05G302400v1 [Gossypium mustelinum]TYJ36364.1 hypothetical protein E1A91_A05G302400v1 [Gossypium mustelinum]
MAKLEGDLGAGEQACFLCNMNGMFTIPVLTLVPHLFSTVVIEGCLVILQRLRRG